jgi:adenosylmethionine-8-amino-7-oxononanoate aminotransferase
LTGRFDHSFSISGNQATANACGAALAQFSMRAVVLTAAEIEKGFLAEMRTIFEPLCLGAID